MAGDPALAVGKTALLNVPPAQVITVGCFRCTRVRTWGYGRPCSTDGRVPVHGLVIADHVPVELQLRVGLPDPDVLYPSAHEPVAVLLADVEVNTVPFTVAAAQVIAVVRGSGQPTVRRVRWDGRKNWFFFNDRPYRCTGW